MKNLSFWTKRYCVNTAGLYVNIAGFYSSRIQEGKMKYTTIIFDFDYTLADTTKGIISSFNYAFSKLDIPSFDHESMKRTVGLPLNKAFVQLTNNENEIFINRFLSLFREKANEVMSKDTILYADTLNTLQLLKKSGLNTGIVTTKNRFRIVETLNLHGGLDLIDIIVGGEDVEVPKPSPEGLLLAIDILNEKRDNVLYIGDSLIDAKTALAANVDFAAVTTGTTKETEFLQYPYVKIVKSLSELFNE